LQVRKVDLARSGVCPFRSVFVSLLSLVDDPVAKTVVYSTGHKRSRTLYFVRSFRSIS